MHWASLGRFLGSVVCLGFALCWGGGGAAIAARPNFIVFIADDMAWDDCGAYGHPSVRTPNMDRLASEGMRFDRAYLTCSSCSPSRCSILTGRYPHATGAGELHLPLPRDQVLVTKPLQQAGYWTAALGKWHLGEAVVGQVDVRRDAPAQQMGLAWVKALQERPLDRPFFLWAAHTDPHRPYQRGAVTPPHDPAAVVVPPYLPDTPEVRGDLALYYDEISRFDEHIGLVLQELQRQQIVDNTFILVISDNGRPFPYCKTQVHVPGVRTPFIVRWPAKVAAGIVSSKVVSSVDIAPTVMELAGLKASEGLQGRSFAPLFADPQASVRTFAFSEHNWHDYRAFERAVHSERYCYVRNWLPATPATPPADAVRSPTFEVMQRLHREAKLLPSQQQCFEIPRAAEFLFDVTQDPHCLLNLARDAAHDAVLKEMRQALEQWQMQTDDVFPGENELTPDGFDRTTGERIIGGAHPSFLKGRKP